MLRSVAERSSRCCDFLLAMHAESIAVAASSILSTFSATHLSRLLLSFALVGLSSESLFIDAAPHIVRLSSSTASALRGVALLH